MKDYMKIYQEWLSNPYFDEDVYKRQVWWMEALT